ncbi:MAG: hypothetical protein DRP29_04420 [Thermodesulfobacteriota bacterium]|nr:MAG: hypothetical protein DRP29_04420 [Thermodesulfobacteriota bacterium]RLG13116.1 MAG: hypothetical protein DRN73_00450 [Candidatus Pacearchaeota archaeon]
MNTKDRVLSLKDWIESFLVFQEEDFQFFQDLLNKKIPFDPENILLKIKNRMDTRKVFYQLYKYLPWEELSMNERKMVEKKLYKILYREELITEFITKLLEALTYLIYSESSTEFQLTSNPFIIH